MGIVALTTPVSNVGLGSPLRNAGAPAAAVNEVSTLTGTATGGTFALTIAVGGGTGQKTAPIAFNASAATVQAAIQALSNVGSGGVTSTGGALGTAAVTNTYAGALTAAKPVTTTVDNTLATGGTVVAAETTAGIPASFANIAPVAAVLNDTANSKLYQNTGTVVAPVWAKVSGE